MNIAVIGFVADFRIFERMIHDSNKITFIRVSFVEDARGKVFDDYIELENASKLADYYRIIFSVKCRIK